MDDMLATTAYNTQCTGTREETSEESEGSHDESEEDHVAKRKCDPLDWNEYMMKSNYLLDQQIVSRFEENINMSLFRLLQQQLEHIIGPVLSNSKMIQHPRFPNQFHFTKSPYFLFETFKERIETKKQEIISTQPKGGKGFVNFGNLTGSEEYYYLLIQNLIQQHLTDVNDHCGIFTTCLYSLVTRVQREKSNFQNPCAWMKFQRGLSKSISYFVQILLPEIILPELINSCECVDPFENPEDTLYNICYTYLIPHVSSSIAHTLSCLMINWLSTMDMPEIYKISASRERFEFFVHAIPFASTESSCKILPGILIGESSVIHSKTFSFAKNGIKCLSLKQVELSNKNVEIDIQIDYISLKTSLSHDIENFIDILERNNINVVLSEDILDEMLVLALAKRNILCAHHVTDIDRICETFKVIPLLIHSITRYNNDSRRHELLSLGKYSHLDLTDHIFTCQSIKQLALGPMKHVLFLEPNDPISPFSHSVLIRAPMESLAETYRYLFFKLLRYLTNSFKFLTQDSNLPTIAIISGGCYFENKLSSLLQCIKTNFKMRGMHEIDSFLDMLIDTYEAVCVKLIENLIPNKHHCNHRETLMQLKRSDSMIISFLNSPKQAISILTQLENNSSQGMSHLMDEGLLIVPNPNSNLIGIYETLSCKYNTLINVCMSLKKLLETDGFFL
ncbi:hypothetical protein C9374_003848 [Naegleria lovaniensis]|uniref:Uncharacterized protein n=1 Tax=Naegleria lovaniensis TaxID=51637 RepID=A0AA88H633_NAELO|nr:uncharacterized protein C9374_003848 [Naegleria lovaniensis]KAG2394084.1 hypothetical protein C9374_003848 [Naegleria lovaniensis]